MQLFRRKWAPARSDRTPVKTDRDWLLIIVGRVRSIRQQPVSWRYRTYKSFVECVDACENVVANWETMGITFEEALATGPAGQQVCLFWHGKETGNGRGYGLLSMRVLD
jgi:hypothetical protein